MKIDDQLVSACLFHPRLEPAGYGQAGGVLTETECNGAVVGGYLHDSRSSDTLLLFFHGNGEIAADYDDIAAVYTGFGVSFWVVDYRGYGRSSGEPSFSSMLRDAEMVFADIPRLCKLVGRQYRRIVVMGRSLGSASAIHLASTYPDSISALVLDSPFADGLALIQRLGGASLQKTDVPGFVDNIDKIHECRSPTLIIHGVNDRIIPVREAQALYDASQACEKELLKIEGAGHNNLMMIGGAAYFGRIKDWIAA